MQFPPHNGGVGGVNGVVVACRLGLLPLLLSAGLSLLVGLPDAAMVCAQLGQLTAASSLYRRIASETWVKTCYR
jgi:hypothetical protein